MIGQDILINRIENITIDTLPRSLILLGEVGSGRHTLFNLIKERLNLPAFDITKNISKDNIDEIYLKVEPILYLIDLDNISIREENMILKLVEEPLKNAYIIFIAKTKTTILPTILNRCQLWELEKYSEEQLRYFLTTVFDNYPDYFNIIDFCTTPGQLIQMQKLNYNINDIINLCNKIIDYIGNARFSNTLTLTNKLSFDSEADKWDYDIFIKIFQYVIKERIKKEDNIKLFNVYKVINQLIRDSQISHINKKQLFENCLFTLRCLLR